MSENIQTPVKTKKARILLVVVGVLFILFLFLSYGAGMIGLPLWILSSYHNRNCDSVLTLDKIYTSLYPGFIEDKTLVAPVRECKVYVSAVAKEETKNWGEAYDGYQAYSSTYPNGIYASEAHQRSAAALLNLAGAQIEQKKYEDALANLDLIVASYSNTAVITDAWKLFPSVYAPWGAGLREHGDFEKSEQILNEFKNWSLTHQQNDATTTAQRELVETYLVWGLELGSQAQFESAVAKFELAGAADPESQFESASKVKAGQSKTYIDWGNALLEQDQFPVAIEKFQLAVTKSQGTNDESAVEALANGQIQWAGKLSAEEDFETALEHLESAKESAATDAIKESVEAALQDTYLAFSQSSGPQARRAMKEVLETVCKRQDAPALPIFGLNKGSVRFGIYGVEEKLPEDLAAKTPGEIHHIACIRTDNKTVESRLHKNVVFQWGRASFYTLVEQFRVQVIWDVSLLQTDTAESVAEETFKGTQPPPFAENAGNYFYGAAPLDEFSEWLKSVLQ
jgi:tetratricopeptide (TPR) repeat protein